MDKFEYKVVILDCLYHIKTDEAYNYPIYYLNTLGDEGWEVCAVDGNKYLLKRKYINMETINTDVFQAIIDFESSKLYSLNEVNNNLPQGKIFYLDYETSRRDK